MEEHIIYPLHLGDKYSLTKTITEYDLWTFAGLTEDYARIHTDYEFAKTTKNGRVICHGLIGANLAGTINGRICGDNGSLFLDFHVEFKAPLFPGDTLTATSTITDIVEKNTAYIVGITCECRNQDGTLVNVVTSHEMCYKKDYVWEK